MSKMGQYALGVQEIVDQHFDSDFAVVESIVRARYPELGELGVNFAREEHDAILAEWTAYSQYCDGLEK